MFITITQELPNTPEALEIIGELDAALMQQPYPQESRHAFDPEKLVREGVAFFILRKDDIPASCGGIKLFGAEYGEVKRMYVRPAFRGLGLAQAILDHLANHARENNINILRLETGIYQVDAIKLYERFGFQRRAPFGEYKKDPMSIYFEKALQDF